MSRKQVTKLSLGWDGQNYTFGGTKVVVLELSAYEHLKKKPEQDTKSAPTRDTDVGSEPMA